MRTRSRLALTLLASAGLTLGIAAPAIAAPSPTDLVTDIVPGAGNGNPYYLTPFDGRLYFVANDGSGDELYVSDGSVGSATNLNLNPTGASTPGGLTVIGNTLYFSATDGVNGEEIWAITGAGAPAMIADIEPGAADSDPFGFTLFNGGIFFQAFTSVTGQSLFLLSGGAVSEYPSSGLSSPDDFFVYNGRLYFSASGADGSQLYAISPNALPQQVGVINAPSSAYPHALAEAGGVLYFLANVSANPGVVEYELWSYNGVTPPTQLTTDLGNQFGYQYFTVFNDTLYFSAGRAAIGRELGYTTGGAAPAYFDINPGAASSNPEGFTVYNGSLFFGAATTATGDELFSITGAAAPVLRADINPGTGNSYPFNFVVSNGKLAFSASSSGNSWQLWSFDGMTANQESAIVAPDPDVYEIVVLGNFAYFTATSTATGYELWRTRVTGASAVAAAALPPTGTELAAPAGVAAALLLAGLALALKRRRNLETQESSRFSA